MSVTLLNNVNKTARPSPPARQNGTPGLNPEAQAPAVPEPRESSSLGDSRFDESITAMSQLAKSGGVAGSAAAKPPSPASPEYGQKLIESLAQNHPELAEGMTPESSRDFDSEEMGKLLDHVSNNPELGGLDHFARSLLEEDNGYEFGPDLDTLTQRLAENTVAGEAKRPNEVSQAAVDMLSEASEDFEYEYQERRREVPPSDSALNKGLDVMEDAVSVQSDIQGRSPDAPEHYLLQDGDGETARFVAHLPEKHQFETIQPGLSRIEDAKVFFSPGADGLEERRLSPEQLRETATEALALAHESQDPRAQGMAQSMLAVVGSEGGKEGAGKVASIYRELEIPLPAYLEGH